MNKRARVAKALLDITLIMLVIGVMQTAVTLVDMRAGTIRMAVPAEFWPNGTALALANGSVGPGSIEMASGVAVFDAPLTSLPAMLYLVVLILQAAPAFVIVGILRRIMATAAEGDPFADANIARVRTIGILIVVFWLLYGALDLALESWVAATSTMQGFRLVSSGGWNLYVLLLSVLIVGLAEIFRHGRHLQADADLTI